MNHRIGDMRITRIDETIFTLAADKLFPDWNADNMPIEMRTHLWVIEREGLTFVVDTGIGNHKSRPFSTLFDQRDNPVLERLTDAGFDRHAIDYVLLTHLHVDHVGWNTQWENGRWAPVFPNATHVFGERERAFFDTPQGEPRRMIYDDSVLPLIDAGLTRTVPDEGAMLVEGVRFLPTFGHSAGHMAIAMESNGTTAIFSGDVMHSPIQVREPQRSSVFCQRPDDARTSRDWLLNYAAERKAAIFTAHFPHTSAGSVERTADGFTWTWLTPT
jgi:glyoxylase-like metal-dependent hydrolase (beta-lactamase superfamily II)